MRTLDLNTALMSNAFEHHNCHCGKCNGADHVVLASKAPLLLDVHDPIVQGFCSTTAGYVKVTIVYQCHLRTRGVSASWQIHNPHGTLVLQSASRPFAQVLVPHSPWGEERLLAMLHVKRTLLEAARGRRAA